MIQTQASSRPGADRPGDDWSGITDPVLRRKLQNRCNQRAARRRRTAAPKGGIASTFPPPLHGHPAQAEQQHLIPTELAVLLMQRARMASQWLPRPPALSVSQLPTAGDSDDSDSDDNTAPGPSSRNTFVSLRKARKCRPRAAFAMTLQQLQARSQELHPLPADHLLSLIYYNVYRGVLQNIAILGLDLNLMMSDEYPSPFLPLSPSASSAIAALPPQLMPTKLQKSIAHHPQWDLFPDPQVRDNVINYGQERIDDLELCLDLVGSQSHLQRGSSDEAGAYLWGEPWLIDSWEVTETFLRKYHWMFKGSRGFAASTNQWRRERGEDEIDFDKVVAEAEAASAEE